MALIRISPIPLELGDHAVNFPSADGVNALSLAANVAETLTIPSGAFLMRIAGTADFYIKANGAATVPADTTDGTASELIKSQGGDEIWRSLAGVSSLSVITAAGGGCIVTASFYVL